MLHQKVNKISTTIKKKTNGFTRTLKENGTRNDSKEVSLCYLPGEQRDTSSVGERGLTEKFRIREENIGNRAVFGLSLIHI